MNSIEEEPLMATVTYFFVDKDGYEACSNYEPYRNDDLGLWLIPEPMGERFTELPPNTIENAFGIKLTYESEPLIIYHR